MNSQYIFCEGNLYLKNNPNYHKTCWNLLRGAASSTMSEMVFKWKTRHLESNRPSRCYRNTTGHCCEAKGVIFFIPAPLIGFAAKTASHLWWTWPCIGKYLEFFHSKTLLQALPRWWPSQLTWCLVLVHVKKTLLLSLWLAVFDSFLLKDSFNCHKT